MAGRKRRKVKLLIDSISDGKKKKAEERKTWSEIPTELLEFIISRLALKENICVSAVCKRWLSAAISVRVVSHPPWIMYFPKFGDIYEFYDPTKRKTYSLKLPELHGSRVCYSKDGWLLLCTPTTHSVFFFNPSSRELIKLPRFEIMFHSVAFSSAPTSPGCIVLVVNQVSLTDVEISTCDPRAAEWVTVIYSNRFPFISSVWDKMVFCNGLFYCLSLTGRLGVFDPQDRTWIISVVPPAKCPDKKGNFMVEHKGDIYLICTHCNQNPIIYKLNQIYKVWETVRTLNGLTLFASFLSSTAREDLLGTMRNSIFFSKVRLYGKHCVSYSLDSNRYYPGKQSHDWGEQDPFECIWIERPKDLSIFR